MLELTPEHKIIVQGILQRNVPGCKIMLFGSRVAGKAKPHSDLDVVIMGEVPLSIRCMRQLRDDFEDSPLPFQVDLVDWAATEETFREIIMLNAVSWDEVAAEGVKQV